MIQRLRDIPAKDKLPAQLLHGLTDNHPDCRLADPLHRGPQAVDNPAGKIRIQEFSSQEQRPGRGVDQRGARVIKMAAPAARHDLVFNERVDGGAVGHPKQRLRQTHHANPLAGGKSVFSKKSLQQIG